MIHGKLIQSSSIHGKSCHSGQVFFLFMPKSRHCNDGYPDCTLFHNVCLLLETASGLPSIWLHGICFGFKQAVRVHRVQFGSNQQSVVPLLYARAYPILTPLITVPAGVVPMGSVQGCDVKSRLRKPTMRSRGIVNTWAFPVTQRPCDNRPKS